MFGIKIKPGGQHNKHNAEQNEKKSPLAELCANKK